MVTFNKLFVVDEDCTRRAAVAFELSKGGYSVLPLEDPNELFRLPPGGAPILVHDNGSAVPKAKELARKRECWSPLVAFDEVCDSQRVAAAAMEGARDYLIWPFSHADVEKSIERSRQWNGNIVNWKVRYEASADKVRNLNLREREVMARVVDGFSSREIGDELGISPRTVEAHRASVISKFKARGPSDSVRIWVEGTFMM
ncbi:MAG TPA: LuxR C-terminal-related transcriptional regulator [Novosphingobium sp.]